MTLFVLPGDVAVPSTLCQADGNSGDHNRSPAACSAGPPFLLPGHTHSLTHGPFSSAQSCLVLSDLASGTGNDVGLEQWDCL